MFRALKYIERITDAIIQRAAFCTLAAMIAVISAQIVARVWFSALSWSEELARYLLVWTSFLGAALAWQRGRHIAVGFLIEMLPSRLRQLCRALAALVAIAFFAVLIGVGVQYMKLQGFQVSASLRIPMPWIYSVIPFSAAVMLYYTLLDLLELFFERARDAEREALTARRESSP